MITHDMGVVANVARSVGVIYAGTMVEAAPVVPVFKEPQHPYTWSLLQSLPRLDKPDHELQPLRGAPPDLVNLTEEVPLCPGAVKHWPVPHRPVPEMNEVSPGSHRCLLQPRGSVGIN